MAPFKARKNGSVTPSSVDEKKVFEMVMGFLEAQAEKDNLNNLNPEQEEDGIIDFDLRPFIKKLSQNEVVNFCKEGDFKLKRTKSAAVLKMVEKAIAQIKIDQDNLWSKNDNIPTELDSDGEIVDTENLVEFKDTNQQNKSVVDLWNIKPAQVNNLSELNTATTTPNVENTTEKSDEPKKSKKRERSNKEKDSSSKRLKGMIFWGVFFCCLYIWF